MTKKQTDYKRANVIWVLCDQLRADAFSYRGDENVRTPNIDNLVRNGMSFDRAVSGAPWCSPFRGALLTGIYPHENGVNRTPSKLENTFPLLTDAFRENDYHTCWIGKWHLDGSNYNSHYIEKEDRGRFDYWLGYENNNNQYETWIHGEQCEEPRRLPGYETDSLTDLLIDHIRDHVNTPGEDSYQPFFATLSVQPPHSPYVPPIDDGTGKFFIHPEKIKLRPNVPVSPRVTDKAKMDLAGYYGMIHNIDWNVGRIRKALKEIGIDRETYIVFFSDHGDCVGSHGQWEKSSPWEESVRIPFIISTLGGGEHMKIGKNDSLMNHVDIGPTTLGLCGIDKPDWMAGYDYSGSCIKQTRPEFRDREPVEREPDSAFLQQIVRKFHPHSVNKTWRGIVTRDGWKYVCMENHEWLLFNLNDDPYEMANLAFDVVYKDMKERCHNILKRWLEERGDDFPLPESI